MAVAVGCACAAAAVELQKDEKAWTVVNPCYSVRFDLNRNGAIGLVRYKGKVFNVNGRFICEFDGQPAEWNGRVCDARRSVTQNSAADGTCKVVEESKENVVLRFGWSLPDGGSAVQTVTCDDTPLLRVRQELAWKETMGHAYYTIASPQANEKTLFYPESRAFPGVYSNGNFSKYPRWKFLSDGARSFGLVAFPDQGWDKFKFARWRVAGHITLYHDYLDHAPAPGSLTSEFGLVFADRKEDAFAAIRRSLGETLKPVELTDIEPDKVFTEKGGENGLTSTVVNNSAAAREVRVVAEVVTGLADVRKVAEETLALKPGEMRVYRCTWGFPADYEWGVASRLKVFDAKTGELLDEKADVTSVSDRGGSAAGCGILNAGQVNVEEDVAGWVAGLKRNYTGMVEYYCWAPATWDADRKAGLAPLADAWRPETEASGYNKPLTKKLVKDLVSRCHANGVHVYSWLTGLVNYRMAYAHPELFQYGKDGQLVIYNGMIDGGKRVATAKLAPYTLEAARDWGDQMADSVDMFGWDGCRWDWGWIPCSPNDPRYADELLKDPHKFEWYDWKGRPAFSLFPDPDGLAAQLLHEWRAAVNKRHPKFVHTTNGRPNDEMFAAQPKYMKETTTDSLGLVEYLLNLTRENRTFEVWARRLGECTRNLRRNGSQGEVGHMSGLCDESVAANLARLTCHASGFKWWGGPADFRYAGAKQRTLPFAMRFSEYFFCTDFRQVDEAKVDAKVSVRDGANWLWRPFVFERTRGGVRELVVHVVNVKPDALIVRRHPPIEAVRNLVVEAKPAKGEKLVEAWGLVPGDEPKAIRLAVEDGRATLPRMEEAASFVFRFGK